MDSNHRILPSGGTVRNSTCHDLTSLIISKNRWRIQSRSSGWIDALKSSIDRWPKPGSRENTLAIGPISTTWPVSTVKSQTAMFVASRAIRNRCSLETTFNSASCCAVMSSTEMIIPPIAPVLVVHGDTTQRNQNLVPSSRTQKSSLFLTASPFNARLWASRHGSGTSGKSS